MLGPTLLPHAANLRLIQVRADWDRIDLVIATATLGAICPCCGRVSRRVHSRYVRRLADLPLRRVQVGVELHVRRFYCDALGCERSIFVERVTGFAERYARRTIQLDEVLRLIAFANGGECGARVARELSMAISPQSLLRLIRRHDVAAIVCGQIIGIDDWAFAKRRCYGAMVVDLEAHRVVDLLPERSADVVREWMQAHPGLEIVARDRGDSFIAGVTAGAPAARQVADRWHLHHNLGEMLKRLVERHLGELHTLIRSRWREQVAVIQDERTTAADAQAMPLDVHLSRGETADERRQRECNARYQQRHDLVHALAREGKSRSAIARLTQLDRKTVRTILSRSEYTGVPQRGQRPSPIDPFKDYIAQRMAEGCVNANQLFSELREKGFTGVYGTVWRMIRRLMRQSPGRVPTSLTAAPAEAQPAIPTAFEITRWLLDKAHALTAQQLTLVQAWVDASPDLQAGRDAARRFTEILTERRADQLDAWIAEALASSVGGVKRFAKGIQADYDAVLAALQLPWSTAQLEGQVNRLKVIKRQMYGRAKFDLLKIRVMTKV